MVYSWSSIGSYHHEKSRENQDVVDSKTNKRYKVISLADGVSSCTHARQGAEIACSSISNLFLKNAEFFLNSDKQQIAELTLSHIIYQLNQQAEIDSINLCEYSSTIASVLYDQRAKNLLFFNLGDCMILGAAQGHCKMISMPGNSLDGCCVTTTKGATRNVHTDIINGALFDSIWIFSDGAWREIFDKNKLNTVVEQMIVDGNQEALKDFLRARDSFDDYSFITVDTLPEGRRRLT